MTDKSSQTLTGGPHSPWGWIPTLYVAEGLPYFAVNVMTTIMYVQMGLSNEAMTFYTGSLYLPWVIKPFWSPFVDLFGTKRHWAIRMQFVIGMAMAGVAFTLGASFFLAATLCMFWIMAFASATHDISADGYYMLELDKDKQAAYVGVRSTFYRVASVIGQGGLVYMVGVMQDRGMAITTSWQICFAIMSVFFFAVALAHTRTMPKPLTDRPMPGVTASEIAKDFFGTFATFFSKPHIITALAFMLLYRLPEALCIKMVNPFLLDSPANGGLGLDVAQIGIANGTVGVIALLAGGIVGGLAISKGGLKKWLWPMALSLTVPCIFYCFMAMYQPQNFLLICSAIGFEQFGYGFGFTAFMMYLMYFAQGENSTSHYAFCTAFMALGMMLPGMAAGWIWKSLQSVSIFGIAGPQGYINFFWLVVATSLATFGVCIKTRRQL